MWKMDKLHEQLVNEIRKRVIAATAQAIRDGFGNLHIEPAWFETFVSDESERLGALARHDTEMFIARITRGNMIEHPSRGSDVLFAKDHKI
jgi:hypothetical protein